ncbi:MAG: HesB/IscA family protein [Oceanococcaceae bacterium]
MIQLTPAAAQRIREQITARGHGVGIRLEVKPSGCSGWAYKLNYADEQRSDDHRFESEGGVLLVPESSLAALDGTEVDFVGDGFNRRWQFHNPNAEADCGCGESFSLRKEAASG